jgi:hypothetical protein
LLNGHAVGQVASVVVDTGIGPVFSLCDFKVRWTRTSAVLPLLAMCFPFIGGIVAIGRIGVAALIRPLISGAHCTSYVSDVTGDSKALRKQECSADCVCTNVGHLLIGDAINVGVKADNPASVEIIWRDENNPVAQDHFACPHVAALMGDRKASGCESVV